MSTINEKVAKLFSEVDKNLDGEGATEFIQALANGLGAFVGLHYEEEAFGELSAVISSHVEKSAIITSKMFESIASKRPGIHVMVVKKEK